jgi:cell fate (sporulation/competence/biofilm development) regulator YmcA (YheA/YmcA/DUF963 family)
MEPQFLINVGFTIAGFFGGWILNSITKSVVRLEDKMADLPLLYVQKEDYRRDIDEVKDMLKQIFNKLDNKADK